MEKKTPENRIHSKDKIDSQAFQVILNTQFRDVGVLDCVGTQFTSWNESKVFRGIKKLSHG